MILELMTCKTKFINPDEEELIDSDTSDIGKRFLLFLGVVTKLYGDKNINTDSLFLKLPQNEKCNITDYIVKSEEILLNQSFGSVSDANTWEKTINWNYWYLDWQLNDLKDKLKRYRIYIQCGNAPDDIRQAQINK